MKKQIAIAIMCGASFSLTACMGGGGGGGSSSIVPSGIPKNFKNGLKLTGKESSDGKSTRYGDASNLKIADFGYIEDKASGDRSYFTSTPGKTSVNEIQSLKNASYEGKFIGSETNSAGTPTEDVSGDVNLSANFTKSEISGKVSNIQGENTTGNKSYDINLVNGKINGNEYSGSSQVVNSGTNTPKANGIYGGFSGSFSGKDAAETTGHLNGMLVDGNKLTGQVNGVFGAKKK